MTTATEYMARTVVNLPFIDERYEPGDMIPHSAFERYADAAAKQIDDRTDKDEGASPLPTADTMIVEFIEWGSITTNPDDGILPEHMLPDPSRPSMQALVSQAEALVAMMEEAGEDVPAKLRALAEISDKQISAVETTVKATETNGRAGGDDA